MIYTQCAVIEYLGLGYAPTQTKQCQYSMQWLAKELPENRSCLCFTITADFGLARQSQIP